MMYSVEKAAEAFSLDEEKSVWKQIKHLSSKKEDITFSLSFFAQKKFASRQEPSLYSHRTGFQSPGNVITVRFLSQNEDWWATV